MVAKLPRTLVWRNEHHFAVSHCGMVKISLLSFSAVRDNFASCLTVVLQGSGKSVRVVISLLRGWQFDKMPTNGETDKMIVQVCRIAGKRNTYSSACNHNEWNKAKTRYVALKIIPYCLKLWPVSYKCLVSFSHRG